MLPHDLVERGDDDGELAGQGGDALVRENVVYLEVPVRGSGLAEVLLLFNCILLFNL